MHRMFSSRFSTLILSLLTVAAIPAAFSTQITYTLTGYFQASGGGQNVNAAFTLTANADTAGITSPSPGVFTVQATSSAITTSGVTTNLALVNIGVTLNTNTGVVSFGNSTGGLALTSASLKTWNMATPIGPLNGPNSLIAGTVKTSDGTVITLTGVTAPAGAASPTFQAAFPVPTVTTVANAASNIGFNSPIAQGGIFILKGSGLGPDTISVASTPFQSTTLSNTSVAVTVGSTTVNALMYYTSAGQVAALLPSNTPTGAGNFVVSYNGQNSAPIQHSVVASNIGIFTIDSSGQGPGIVTYADYSLVSAVKGAVCGGPNTACGAANPGDTLILWATGLGPVTGNEAAGAGLGVAQSSVPLTLYLGGVQVPVIYQGRSGCCVGEDQIVFTVPNNVPTGCAVPLVIQIGTTANTVSNTTVIPIATGSRNCTTSNPSFTSLNFSQFTSATPVTVGDIDLEKNFDNKGNIVDQAYFQFVKFNLTPGLEPFLASFIDHQPPGTCIANGTLNLGNNIPGTGFTQIDGGSSVAVKGPNGSVTLQGNSSDLTTINQAGTFLVPGAFTVSGTGGKDVGAFTASITIPALPTLSSPSGQGNNVTRASGLAVTWKGGDPNSIVDLDLISALDNTFTLGSEAHCRVAGSAGSFNVPPYVLLALPTGNFASIIFGGAQVSASFTAPGLTVATLHTQSQGTLVPLSLR
jgi:uncharacterized protein (TIGR03437 family)